MLTNLDWLDKGRPYPPPSEAERIKAYDENERLFETKHMDVWADDFEKLAKRLKKRGIDFNVDTVLNYHQLLSKKTADFVCGETPTIELASGGNKLDKILSDSQWASKLYEAFIDVSRYGNAIPKLVGDRLTAVAPRFWFPIVDMADLKHIVLHVIAYPVTPDDKGVMTELYVEIHNIGSIETRLYKFDGEKNEVGALKEEGKTEQTGLDTFAVLPLTNVTHSSSVFGVNDYTIINSIVARILWRLHCIDKVLDKHSEPSVSGPSSALELDPKTGMYFLNLGTYFKRNSEQDPDLKYITWDGNLDASFKEIEVLLNQLYTLSEMGQAFSEAAGGTSDSGEALKLRMVSPRIKAARLVGINNDTVKKTVALLAGANGLQVKLEDMNIHWYDGLPDDEKEQVEILTTATGGAPIMSQYSAIKRRGLSDKEVEEELEQMANEGAANAPSYLSSIDGNSLSLENLRKGLEGEEGEGD